LDIAPFIFRISYLVKRISYLVKRISYLASRFTHYASRTTLYDPFPATFKAGKAAICCRAFTFTLRALFSCALDRNHTFAITDRAGNPGASRIDTGCFAEGAFNRRLHNLNPACSFTYLTDGQLREQIKRVFACALTEGALYPVHLSLPS